MYVHFLWLMALILGVPLKPAKVLYTHQTTRSTLTGTAEPRTHSYLLSIVQSFLPSQLIKKNQTSTLHYSIFFYVPGLKNRINGTQRTEQSEVYGTKKEEKREKRRKLVQYFVPKCSYYLCPGTYLKWCQNPNFNTYTGYFSIQFFDCYFMVQIVKYSDFP